MRKFDPFSSSVVRPLRLALRDWSTWKTPAENAPSWMSVSVVLFELVIRAWPSLASTRVPIGISRGWVTGWKSVPFWLARAPVPGRSISNTFTQRLDHGALPEARAETV